MKYRKNEAKEYAKKVLQGVWTALPTSFTHDDKVDEKGNAANLELCISGLKLEGHYCIGNVGEFWSMTNEERMRVVEINVDVAKGRIPLIAGCHHQNPYEALKLTQHAQAAGIGRYVAADRGAVARAQIEREHHAVLFRLALHATELHAGLRPQAAPGHVDALDDIHGLQ